MNKTIEISNSPADIISDLKFSPSYNHLLASSWNGSLDLYDLNDFSNITKLSSFISPSPILALAYDDLCANRVFCSNADGTIREIDLENGNCDQQIGESHDLGVNNLKYVPNSSNLLAAGSWDGKLQYLDVRNNSAFENSVIHTQKLPQKIISMDATNDKLVISMTNRLIHIYDFRNFTKPLQIRESGLKYQTKDLQCMPNGKGFAQSSIEGRVAIEYFDPSEEEQSKKYAFKCHRINTSDYDIVSPVNTLCFHKKSGALFTGGSDQHVCLWDHVARKRMKQYSKLPDSIVKLALNNNDMILAIGVSDDSFKHTRNLMNYDNNKPARSKIFLKFLSDNEGQTKSKTKRNE